ncbi:MAG: metallopeptidase family protein [Actinomycetota bacterium]|nr:metallopeptidase family protein [Actinomycetota bacterium]
MAIDVDTERFEELVADALDSLPDDIAERLDNVWVKVEDWPSRAQLRGRRGTLLGLYEGVNLTRRGPVSYKGVMPDRITIFRGPHLRICRTEAQLATRVRTTVLHELGHHVGLSERRLRELGCA